MKKLSCFILILLLILTSVFIVGSSEPQNKPSKIYIFRDQKHNYAVPVFVNGILIGGLEGNQFFHFETSLEEIKIASLSRISLYEETWIDLIPGHEYYFRCFIDDSNKFIPLVRFTLQPQNEGREKIKQFEEAYCDLSFLGKI